MKMYRKKIYSSLDKALVCVCILLLGACSKNSDLQYRDLPEAVSDLGNGNSVGHEMMELGDKLENPYAVKHMRQAYQDLYPTKSVDLVQPTHLYVRVLPKSSSDIEDLKARGASVTDFPLDYEIVKDGDYYHDSEIPEDEITWQYVVVPRDFNFGDLDFEVLDDCFIADDEITKSFSDIDWAAVEEQAFRITGNETKLAMTTKAGGRSDGVNPTGRITIVDDDFNRGKPFGLAEVKVQCNVFVKFSSTFTDRDGYYTIPEKFKANPHYRIIFENKRGFAIGVNLILVKGSICTLGKHTPDGVSLRIDKDSDTKLWKRSIVNNAAYDYFTKCSSLTDYALGTPPANIRIWLFNGLRSSSATMLHHGALTSLNLLEKWIGEGLMFVVRFLMPDITIGTNGCDSYSELYSTTCHEMAHSSHYGKVGNDYWDEYIKYILRCFLRSPADTYGDGTLQGAGYCAVGEMWAYYMESKMYQSRYGGAAPVFGNSYWFHPQIFHYLGERGLSPAGIFSALNGGVVDLVSLQEQLINLFPARTKYIQQAFSKYEE